jgi:hypothetical protein
VPDGRGGGWFRPEPLQQLPEITSTSGHFIAIFEQMQKLGYDQTCASHTLISISPPFMGAHGNRLVVCVFKKGKRK